MMNRIARYSLSRFVVRRLGVLTTKPQKNVLHAAGMLQLTPHRLQSNFVHTTSDDVKNVVKISNFPYSILRYIRPLIGQSSAYGNNGRNGGYQNEENNNAKMLVNTCLISSGALMVSLFSKQSDHEKSEEKLIHTIKRCILCMQKNELEKAERMLHLALRMAQDIQSQEGITFVYDLMANLAMERGQFVKAERIFADVMKRLLGSNFEEDCPQILHISAKLAHIAQQQGRLEKAQLGFDWTLEKLDKRLGKEPKNDDLVELLGLTKNWYGQLLMKTGKYEEAKEYLEGAYTCLDRIHGSLNSPAISILNNISVACSHLENYNAAKEYLEKAMQICKEIKDDNQEGVLKANMGLLYLREGLIPQAKKECVQAWRMGKKLNDNDAIGQAEYCLKEIKLVQSTNAKKQESTNMTEQS